MTVKETDPREEFIIYRPDSREMRLLIYECTSIILMKSGGEESYKSLVKERASRDISVNVAFVTLF